MDTIHVSGIEAYGHHGVYDEERKLGQWLVVDLMVGCDLGEAGRTDDLTTSISYVDLARIAREVVETTGYMLIEKIAQVIADRILEIPRAQEVTVSVAKPEIPHPDVRGRVSVTLTRRRA